MKSVDSGIVEATDEIMIIQSVLEYADQVYDSWSTGDTAFPFEDFDL